MAKEGIYPALLAVQESLKVPKAQRNEFANYKYRSCEDILEAVKPLCVSHGLLLTLTDEAVQVGGRYYIKATASVTDGKDAVKVEALAREEETKKGMDASQITGTASSYARKYALNGLFCIDDTKDADTMPPTEEKPKPAAKGKPAPAMATKSTLLQIAEKAGGAGISNADVNAIITGVFHKANGYALTESEAQDLLSKLIDYHNDMTKAVAE